MLFAHKRRSVVITVVMAAAVIVGQNSSAMADDDGRHEGSRHGSGRDGLPVMVVSPAPGKITKERRITDTYEYSTGSSSQPPEGGSAPMPPEPGPVTMAKDTVNSVAQSATAGASSTVDAVLK